MRYPDYIPQGDIKFLEWATVLIHNLGKSLERFDFPKERYAQLKQLLDDFIRKFDLAITPATRTAPAVLAKNNARQALKEAIRQAVKEHLTYNRLLADDDRKVLGLPIYKTTRTRTSPPTEKPDFSIEQATGSRLKVHYHAHDEEKGRSNAKPPGVHGIEIVWAILGTPPLSYADLVHSASATRSPHVFQFDLSDAGKRFYCCVRWENTRSEKGPWSEIQSAIIP